MVLKPRVREVLTNREGTYEIYQRVQHAAPNWLPWENHSVKDFILAAAQRGKRLKEIEESERSERSKS